MLIFKHVFYAYPQIFMPCFIVAGFQTQIVSLVCVIIVPLQLISHVVQNRCAGEQQTHWGTEDKQRT